MMPTERDAPRCETCGGTGEIGPFGALWRPCPDCAARPPVGGLREAGDWRGDGPCVDCGTLDNIVWSAPSPLWNEVMGPDDRYKILCPTCFAKRAASVNTVWVLAPEATGEVSDAKHGGGVASVLSALQSREDDDAIDAARNAFIGGPGEGLSLGLDDALRVAIRTYVTAIRATGEAAARDEVVREEDDRAGS